MQFKFAEINVNTSRFRKSYTDLECLGLKPTPFVLLNYAYDLMKMSWKNPKYYDKKYNDYYCIAQHNEIMKRWNIGSSTITRTYAKLEKMGYVIRKKAKSGVTKLFCPHLSFVNNSPKIKMSGGQLSKWADIKSNCIKIDGYYTVDTSSVSSHKNKNNIILKFNYNKSNSKNNQTHKKSNEKNKLLNLKHGLLKSKVPAKVIKTAFGFYNDYKTLHNKVFASLFEGKKKALKYASKQPDKVFISMQLNGFVGDKKAIKDAFSFENNDTMCKELPEAFRRIVFKAEHDTKNSRAFKAYMRTGFCNFFLDAAKKPVNDMADYMIDKNLEPDIPIFKIK